MNKETMQLEPFKRYLVEINVRPEYKGRPANERAVSANGKTFEVECLWLMDDEDPYPEEYALMAWPKDNSRNEEWDKHFNVWLASGDVKVLEELGE